MSMMLAPDLLDRRALALIAVRDAFGRAVTSPVIVEAAGVRTVVKTDGTIAVIDAPGFAAYGAAFAAPPANPAVGSVSLPLDILPADPCLQARRYVLKLPRDPDPAKRGQANSLFTPVAVELLATPLQRRDALAGIIRVRVHRKSDGALVGGALVRIRSTDGKFEARGVTDRAGEAALVVPNLPLGFAGSGGKMDASLAAKAIVKVNPASAIFTLPGDLPVAGSISRAAGPFDPDELAAGPAPNFAGGTPFNLSAGTEPSLELEWKQP
jgi:hypothetical protein